MSVTEKQNVDITKLKNLVRKMNESGVRDLILSYPDSVSKEQASVAGFAVLKELERLRK